MSCDHGVAPPCYYCDLEKAGEQLERYRAALERIRDHGCAMFCIEKDWPAGAHHPNCDAHIAAEALKEPTP